MTTHVVALSGGVTSWAAGKYVQDRLRAPGDRLVLLFADTKMEDESTYRFLEQSAANIGEPVTRIADGRTPREVFRDERFLGNNRVAVCSRVLKRDLIDTWREENCDRETSVHYVGLDWTETNRWTTHERALSAKGWKAAAPLIDGGIGKPEAIRMADAEGLTLPDLYREGFSHANCGGMCVRAGIGHWTLLYRMRPELYRRAEAEEAKLAEWLGRADVAILRDRTGGKTRPLPLWELRKRIEAQPELCFDDSGGCGCALEGGP